MTTLFRRILVPHDFSRPADHALEVAADLALESRGRLVVLHVVPPYPFVGFTPAEEVPLVSVADLVRPARAHLEHIVRRIVGRRRVSCESRVVVGDPVQEIVLAARRADVVVMATAGRTGLGHLLIGSVAERVVRHASCPVLTLRGGRASSPARSRRPRVAPRRGGGI
jgi:nucleotide-binding universal stress UspA family protein